MSFLDNENKYALNNILAIHSNVLRPLGVLHHGPNAPMEPMEAK